MAKQISRRTVNKGLAALALTTLASRNAYPVRAAGEHTKDVAPPTTPNILVIVFDTLSAPHMSLYGYPRRTTPNLERFAQQSTVYHAHSAGGNFTTSGTASLLTGTYPWTHRAFNHKGTVTQTYRDHNLFGAFAGGEYNRVAYSHNLLADSLLNQFSHHIDVHIHPDAFCLQSGHFAHKIFPGDADIASRSFDNLVLRRGETPSSLFLSLADRVRLAVGKRNVLGSYGSDYPRGVQELFKLMFVLEDTIDGITATVDTMQTPFLAYFHLLPPHEPYRPHRDFIGIFADQIAPPVKEEHVFSQGVSENELRRLRLEYDEFLAYADSEFGRLLDYLEESGRMDDTIVVFTSDHGQMFERGIHGHITQTLYDPVLHVPLLISLPGQMKRHEVFSPTSCVDLVPTLAYLAGLEPPEWSEGHVLPGLGQADVGGERSVVAIEAKNNPKQAPLTKATVSLQREDYKLITYLGYDKLREKPELYDIQRDPEELENLAARHSETTSDLLGEVENQLSRAEGVMSHA